MNLDKEKFDAIKVSIPQSISKNTWQALSAHFTEIKNQSMKQWFVEDIDRANHFTRHAAGITIDFSKNFITSKTISLLTTLADESQLAIARQKMFSGEKINFTENRSVLHTMLRSKSSINTLKGININGISEDKQSFPEKKLELLVNKTFKRMREFVCHIRNGTYKGFTGKNIDKIVNIGIGGSDLGPKMVVNSLQGYIHAKNLKNIPVDFISNVDGCEVDRICRQCNPETTLFVIVSKTFTTQETLSNAETLKKWLLNSGCQENDLKHHLVAVSANKEEAQKFGISEQNIFEMWDWVGGRYSLWSAVGLSIMLAMGSELFADFLDGAREMDEHFLNAPWSENLPVLLALIGIWYRNFYQYQTLLVSPYYEPLHYLPSYLQQLDMESNGKSTNTKGERICYQTAPIIWGETGTNGQHAFFQMLHQGTTIVPVDFIAILEPYHTFIEHHKKLLANCFAQSEALMIGRSEDDIKQLSLNNKNIAHMQFDGNRPSNTILLNECNPRSLGSLLALYENKIFAQGKIWDINSFDQFGVELGKQLGRIIELELLEGKKEFNTHDGSTKSLINYARKTLEKLKN